MMYGHRFRNIRMQGSGGLGVIAHELLRSFHTAKVHGYRFGFLRDGLEYPELFGNRNWLDFFEGQIVDRCDVEWPNQMIGFAESASFPGNRRMWYHGLAKEIMTLRPEIQKEIDAMIARTGFLESDCVVHIRRTDKVSEIQLNDLNDYVESVVQHIPTGTRIFLLSDDPSIRTEMQELMQKRGYSLMWDEEDTTIHCQRIGNDSFLGDKTAPPGEGSSAVGIIGKFSEDELYREILTAIKLIQMMSKAQYLIGARVSMLFRMGEILNPNFTFSLRDFSATNLGAFFWPYIDPEPRSDKVFGHRFKNFRIPGTGGFGMIFHELILSLHACRVHGYRFGFLRDGLGYPELFGGQNWLDFFKGQIVDTCDVEWPSLIEDHRDPPNFDGTRQEWFRKLAHELFVLRPEIQKEMDEMIQRTGFQNSDCVVHIRRTDKVSETSLDSLEDYAKAIIDHVPNGTRIFLLTDDPAIRTDMKKLMQSRGYPLTWDEEDITIHCQRIGNESYLGMKDVPKGIGSQAVGIVGKFSDSELKREIMTAIKLILIMSRAQYLIGARISMLFRVGEVLNSNTTFSLKDFDKWSCSFVEQKKFKFPNFGNFQKFIIPDFCTDPSILISVQQFKWWESTSGLNYLRSAPNSRHYSTCNCCLCALTNNLSDKSFQRKLEQISGKTFRGYHDICLIRMEEGNFALERFTAHLLVLFLSDDDGGQLSAAGLSSPISPKFGKLVFIQNPQIIRIAPVKNRLFILRVGVILL